MNINDLLSTVTTWLIHHGLKIILISIGTLVLLRIARAISRRTASLFLRLKHDTESKKRADTFESVIRNVFGIMIFLLGLTMILAELGVEIGPLLAAAGVAGLALGFAGQSLVKDVINGFFILMEDQLRVGDYVTVAGIDGQVERINLKLTVLRDWDGNMHFIPNSRIEVVTNKTRDFSRYVMDIGVAYRENVDDVIAVIREVDVDLRSDENFESIILNPVEILGLDRFDDSAVVIKARLTTRPGLQWKTKREFYRRLKIRFDERDIEIPFPHCTLYMGRDKDGTAPPLRIRRENAS